MGMRGVLAAAGAVVVVTGGLSLAGASPASADQVWHQSVSRASATAACSTSSADDLAAGWSQWGATWEQWVNGGKGGFTCARSITWALDAPADEPTSIGGCNPIEGGMAFLLVGPSGFVTNDPPYFDNEACTLPSAGNLNAPYGLAWTSGDEAAAIAICRAGNPGQSDITAIFSHSSWWVCHIYG